MKKVSFIFIFIIFIICNHTTAEQLQWGSVHKYIVRQAWELAKYQRPDLEFTDLAQHIGNSENGNGPWQKGSRVDMARNFCKKSFGFRYGYFVILPLKVVWKPTWGFFFIIPLADTTIWYISFNVDTYPPELHPHVFFLNVQFGTNLPLTSQINLRPFAGLGDWQLQSMLRGSFRTFYGVIHGGLSVELKVINKLIISITSEQRYIVPYRFLPMPSTLAVGARYYW